MRIYYHFITFKIIFQYKTRRILRYPGFGGYDNLPVRNSYDAVPKKARVFITEFYIFLHPNTIKSCYNISFIVFFTVFIKGIGRICTPPLCDFAAVVVIKKIIIHDKQRYNLFV